MEPIAIIPAIDIIEGKCVRLSKGDYSTKKVYNENPVEVALAFEAAGINRLHLVDLDGAKAGTVKNWKVLETLATKTNLQIDFGGGVKSMEDCRIIFDSGSTYTTLGSIAAKDEQATTAMLMAFGAEKFLLGADVNDELLAVGGWLEKTDIHVSDFIDRYAAKDVQQFFCTDIAKDGMMQGPSLQLYKKLLAKHNNIQLIASGGVRNTADIEALQQIGMHGVIIGKAFYEGQIRLTDLKQFLF